MDAAARLAPAGAASHAASALRRGAPQPPTTPRPGRGAGAAMDRSKALQLCKQLGSGPFATKAAAGAALLRPVGGPFDAAATLAESATQQDALDMVLSDKFGQYLEDLATSPHEPASANLPPPPPAKGIRLGTEERTRFYGAFSGKQVEEELRRLWTILQGLLHEFTLVKNSVWHIEDERSLLGERLDKLEQGKVDKLSDGLKSAVSRLNDFGNRFELMDLRTAHLEDSSSRLSELLGRVELMDMRLATREVSELVAGLKQSPCELNGPAASAEARLDALISAEGAAAQALARVLVEDYGSPPATPGYVQTVCCTPVPGHSSPSLSLDGGAACRAAVAEGPSAPGGSAAIVGDCAEFDDGAALRVLLGTAGDDAGCSSIA